MKIKLKGDFNSGRVWLDGKLLDPQKSLRIARHSPTSFNWGYSGSGPAQLALAICIEIFGIDNYKGILYQQFKSDIIANLPQSDFNREISIDENLYFYKTE